MNRNNEKYLSPLIGGYITRGNIMIVDSTTTRAYAEGLTTISNIDHHLKIELHYR